MEAILGILPRIKRISFKIEEISVPEYWCIWKKNITSWDLLLNRWNYLDSMVTTSVILELPHLKNGAWLFYELTLDFF